MSVTWPGNLHTFPLFFRFLATPPEGGMEERREEGFLVSVVAGRGRRERGPWPLALRFLLSSASDISSRFLVWIF